MNVELNVFYLMNKIEEVIYVVNGVRTVIYDVRDVTFPSSPLCFDRIPPPFFTATSSVLLCNSTSDTLNSNLHKQVHATHKHFI